MKWLMVLVAVPMLSFADSRLAGNGKVVECSGADNQSLTLNAKRTTVKYTVEGESLGPKKIERVVKKRGSISYVTEDLTLTLSDAGDTFQYDGGDVEEVDCE